MTGSERAPQSPTRLLRFVPFGDFARNDKKVNKEVIMKRYIVLALALVFVSTMLAGCGETVSGIGKDASRIGKGVQTIFVRDGN